MVFLLILLVVGALPDYSRGKAPLDPIPQASLQGLKTLFETGLELPGWTTLDLRTIKLGPNDWVMQTLSRDGVDIEEGEVDRATVLLHPQTKQSGTSAQPQMEWLDVRGLGRVQGDNWTEDQNRHLRFSLDTANADFQVTARYFRGWSSRQTFAVAQWYAWERGGHPSLIRWFWRDRTARLVGDRIPWVAVSILLPIEPLGDIQTVEPLTTSLAQKVQTALIRQGFTPSE